MNYSDVAIGFSIPQQLQGEFRAKFYELLILPQPVMQSPPVHSLPFVFNVRLKYSTQYRVNITAVSCGGRSSSSTTVFVGEIIRHADIIFAVVNT
jgi:hypothetical protein